MTSENPRIRFGTIHNPSTDSFSAVYATASEFRHSRIQLAPSVRRELHLPGVWRPVAHRNRVRDRLGRAWWRVRIYPRWWWSRRTDRDVYRSSISVPRTGGDRR